MAADTATTAQKGIVRAGVEFPRPRNAPVTQEQRDRFLAALADGSTVTEAAAIAGFNRSTAYDMRREEEDFARAWLETLEDGTQRLEQEATRRALDGSDLLMIFLLKARRPEVYRDRYEVHHTTGEPLTAPDLQAIRASGQRPELAASLDSLADAIAEEHRGRITPRSSDVVHPPSVPPAAAGDPPPGGGGGSAP